MPTYIALGKLTSQGKQNPSGAMRARDQVFAEFQKKGVKVTSYVTLGPYDVVLIVDAPTEETLMQFLFASGAGGNLDTITMRAFTPQETERLRAG